MGKIIFILGGARSGKSTYAINLAKRIPKRVAFIATCASLDKEMKKRIRLHQTKRPSSWQTFEETKDIAALLKKIRSQYPMIIIDCLTLLISNLLLAGFKENTILDKINEILKILKSLKGKAIIVANEVGLGIVPNSKLGRDFRDLAGKVNQLVVQKADEVFFMVSGLPLKVKG